jgi:hypothetical protein
MIRVLVMIAVAGFLVSLASLTAAVTIGGPELLESAAWGGWSPHWVHRSDSVTYSERWSGGEGTRDMAWSGGDALEVDVPADVQYTQGPETKLTVTGPQREIDDLDIEGGRLTWRHDRHHHMHFGGLRIVATAPGVTRFELSGSGNLVIANYKQDKLDLRISGNGDVTATGDAGDVMVDVSGSGDADLGGLKSRSADIEISGSGEAKAAPTDSAKVRISGSGDVTLLTHPPRLDTNISGSGELHQDAAAAPPAQPATPAAPAKPAPKKGKSA